MTWHGDNLTWERGEGKSGWERLHRWNIYHWKLWNASLSPLSTFFLTWHRGTRFPLRRPIYAISEREVITQERGGMFFILSSLPATLLEIRLLSGRLKAGACCSRPVWQPARGGMPPREHWGFDPQLFTISVIKHRVWTKKHLPTLLERHGLKILVPSPN